MPASKIFSTQSYGPCPGHTPKPIRSDSFFYETNTALTSPLETELSAPYRLSLPSACLPLCYTLQVCHAGKETEPGPGKLMVCLNGSKNMDDTVLEVLTMIYHKNDKGELNNE
jgi:hypothetical protein